MWSVTWQSQTVSPYAFCKNDNPNNAKKANEAGSGWNDTAGTACRTHIVQCLEQPQELAQLTNAFRYVPNKDGEVYVLNQAE